MADLHAEIEAARAAIEDELIPEVERVLVAQGRAIATAVSSAGTADAALAAADEIAADVDVAADVLEAVYLATAEAFGEAAYEAIAEAVKRTPSGVSWAERVRAFLAAEGAVMVREITETTRRTIRRVLRKGVDAGEGVAELARRLRRDWPDVGRVRAEAIVRTEVMAASNAAASWGAEAAAEEFDLELEKEWIATADGRTRDTHRALDGERVGLGEDFDVGGHPAAYPGDARLPAKERVRCRCAVAHRPKKPAKGASRERYAARNEFIRGEYDRRVRKGAEFRDTVLGELSRHPDVLLSVRQVRRIVDERPQNG